MQVPKMFLMDKVNNLSGSGLWGVGVATEAANLEKAPVIENAWVLRQDGAFYGNGQLIGQLDSPLEEGDSIVRRTLLSLQFFTTHFRA